MAGVISGFLIFCLAEFWFLLSDYVAVRLKKNRGTHKLGVWLEKTFDSVRLIPRYLIPRYFDAIITGVYSLLISRASFLMSE